MVKLNITSIIDLFSQPMRLNLKFSNGSISHKLGSWVGIALTGIGMIIWFGYLIILL